MRKVESRGLLIYKPPKTAKAGSCRPSAQVVLRHAERIASEMRKSVAQATRKGGAVARFGLFLPTPEIPLPLPLVFLSKARIIKIHPPMGAKARSARKKYFLSQSLAFLLILPNQSKKNLNPPENCSFPI